MRTDALVVTRYIHTPSVWNEAEPKERLYFDVLKDDENENITGYVSAHPYVKDWAAYIDEQDFATLYYIDGELGSFNCTRFFAIALNPVHDEEYEEERDDAVNITEINLALKIVERACGNFKTIRMDAGYEKLFVGNSTLNELSKRLYHTESLRMWQGEDPAILQNLWQTLQED